jgi:hypothetical protein
MTHNINNNVNKNNNALYFDIVINGSPFNSPVERYGPNIQIVCDRCQNSPITQGYGYKTNDMCLPCVNKIKQQFQTSDADQVRIRRDMNLTLMEQDQYTTNMMQRQYNPPSSSNNLTFMMQDMFRSSVDFNNLQAFNDTGNGGSAFASVDSLFGDNTNTKTNNPNVNELIGNRGGNGWSGLTRMSQSMFNRKN